MAEEELRVLTKSRQYVRQRLSKLCQKVLSQVSTFNRQQRNLHIDTLSSIREELKDLNKSMFPLYIKNCFADDKIDSLVDEEEIYDDKVLQALSLLRTEDNSSAVPASVVQATGNSSNSSGNRNLKLPRLPLPVFSNEPHQSFSKFLRSFESIVDKQGVTGYEKFAYLKDQLSKGPRSLIDSLDVEQQSYDIAKDLLRKAFDREVNTKHDMIKNLTELNLHLGKDPYTHIGEMRTIIAGFESLKITVEDVLQYFMWKALDVKFQDHLTHITNKSRPGLKEIIDSMFEATDRYVKQLKPESFAVKNKKTEQKEQLSMAVNVENFKTKNKFCILCEKDGKNKNHDMRNCENYKTSFQKINKLKSMKACAKCSFRNHETAKCKYKFSSMCRQCGGPHMSYLCDKVHAQTTANTVDVSEDAEVTSSLSVVETLQSYDDDSVILPTLTTELVSPSKPNVLIHIFKDGGSQKNFITKSLAYDLNLVRVKTNISLHINGFNSSRKIVTDIFEVKLVIGNKVEKIHAVGIDEIQTKFRANGIENIVQMFENKGYEIADSKLKCSLGLVGQFDLILGAESDEILPMSYKLFGDDPKSVYIDTPAGIMFTGSLKSIKSNLQFLEPASVINSINTEVSGEISPDIIPDCDYSMMYSDPDSKQCSLELDQCDVVDDPDFCAVESETNTKLIEYVLQNTDRDDNGRLIMPLTWNCKNSHLLGKNYNLSLKILNSTFQKLKNDPKKLELYDSVFKEQRDLGILEKIPNIEQFMSEHPECSFMPHMGVFKLARESTKCRVVYLSNLCETDRTRSLTVSHNQAILPGPTLNHTTLTALMLLRFDSYMMLFDIKKAFLAIALREMDQNRLMCLWYRNVSAGDFSIVAYRSKRLSFGLRCSPALLLLGLYKILMLDTHEDDDLTLLARSVYNTIYMDNGCYSCNNPDKLIWAYHSLVKIFGKYKFELQQFYTNDLNTQNTINSELNITDSEFADDVKLFGLTWCRTNDTLSPVKPNLNAEASSKREILSTLNSIYDSFGLYIPLLLRAKIFVQKLQKDKELSWDTLLSDDLRKEWLTICKQVNSVPRVDLRRFVGQRDSDYQLIAFTDASRDACGCVIYIKDLTNNTVSFLCANSKLFAENLRKKSIPCLEFYAIYEGVNFLMNTLDSLAGETIVSPVNILSLRVFTDSMVSVHWLNAYINAFDKLRGMSVFVKNRLRQIDELCRKFPVTFGHTAGQDNPADCTTKPYSYRSLSKTNYYVGPQFLTTDVDSRVSDITVTIPNPSVSAVDEVQSHAATTAANACSPPAGETERPEVGENTHLVPIDKYSNLKFLVNVCSKVLKFVDILKRKVQVRKGLITNSVEDKNYYLSALLLVISREQKVYFADVFSYLRSPGPKKDLPPLMSQMNLYIDENSVIRIKSKFGKCKGYNPILLPRQSYLTRLIVVNVHEKLAHAGLYAVLREIKKEFHITHYFSVIRKILKNCIVCRKLNERPVKLNQGNYRSFRTDPTRSAFSDVFLDYAGPYNIKLSEQRQKVWLLIVTCTWSRAINLKICLSANVDEFLRALQLHIYDHGLFSFCVSDLGSQIKAGSNVVKTFLSDSDAKEFFDSHGIKPVSFKFYPKGNSALGSLIESCVKQVKHLVQKSIRSVVLDYFDFSFLIAKALNIINKRPIAFKASLRTLNPDEVPEVITPEMLLRGCETRGINVVPQLQVQCDDGDNSDNFSEQPNINSRFAKLSKARTQLLDVYHSEFLTNLIEQAIDKNDRYKPVLHKLVRSGDIVLLVEKNTKRYLYPMGRVVSVEYNDLGEATAAYVVKGTTGEKVYRHVSSLILLLSPPEVVQCDGDAPVIDQQTPIPTNTLPGRKPREAAQRARDQISAMSRAHTV